MVVIHAKEFQDVYRRHVIQGGLYGQMAKRAATAITHLTHGLPTGAATTNNGESRLRNYVKYSLNDGFRLVTVQEGGRCFVLYMGSVIVVSKCLICFTHGNITRCKLDFLTTWGWFSQRL
jgi:hypothetical protein